jgi:outer membrane protease
MRRSSGWGILCFTGQGERIRLSGSQMRRYGSRRPDGSEPSHQEKRVMKNLSWVLLAVLLLPASGGAAFQAGVIAGPKDGKGVPFAVQGSVGLLNGEANEHVYDYETLDGSRRQLSRLDWDLKDVMMGGFNGSVRLMDKLTVNGGYWSALTQGSGGEMDDYDWLEPTSGDWTHYSLSEVDVTEGYIFDLNVAWDLVNWEDLTGRVFAGYKQDGWSWEDSGVYLLYPEYGYVPQDLNGENLINYEQEFRIPYLGASADWTLGHFTFSGGLTYSPFVSATDWDEHVARSLYFEESFEGGDMFGFGLEARYAFTQGFWSGAFVSAALDYQMIDLIVGDMKVYDASTGDSGGEEDVAGIENEYLVLALGLGVHF